MLIAERYELGEVIGEGGMGSVVRAVDRKTGRVVAVKLMRPHLADDEAAARRFEREMHTMMLIEHPNTVRLYDSGRTDDGELYLVMELVDGRLLGDELDALGALPVERVVRIGQHIARALSAVHAKGIVHRDLKPQNIMLRDLHGEPDWVVVLDFGIATLTNASRVTETGLVAGSALYISPEQAMGAMPGPAGDLYMLGVVLFEMLTGRLPFEASTPHGYLYAHVHSTPASLAKLRSDAPRWLVDLIEQMLRKKPEERPADAAEVLTRLTARGERAGLRRSVASHPFVDTNVVGAESDVADKTTTTMSTRRRIILPLLGLTTVGAVVIAGTLTGGAPRSSEAAPNLSDIGADAAVAIASPAPTAPEDAVPPFAGSTVDAADVTPRAPEDTSTTADSERASEDATRVADDVTAPPAEHDALPEVTNAPETDSPRSETKPPPQPPRLSIAITSEPKSVSVIAPGRTLKTPASLRCDRGQVLTLRFEKPQYLPATRTLVCGDTPKLHVVLKEP